MDYKRCLEGNHDVPCFIITTDETGQEQCPYCGGHDFGPVKHPVLCSLEAYLASMAELRCIE